MCVEFATEIGGAESPKKHGMAFSHPSTRRIWSFAAMHLVDYRKHPCFCVAYYSAEVRDKCLEFHLGGYSIITDRAKRESIVIGFCPWCSVRLPTGVVMPDSSNRGG